MTKEKMTMAQLANTLRAGVLGSNDGILTVVGVLFTVAVATTNHFTIFIAGLSDLLACAFSMASGEYASVSSQRDTEKAVVKKEKALLKTNFDDELKIVENYYIKRGVSATTAMAIAKELMAKQPLKTILHIKYDLELGHYVSSWYAAFASLFSAAAGGLFPLVAMTCLPSAWRWLGTIIAVSFSVALTGFLSAKLGKGDAKRAMLRNVIIGWITMCIHYGLGKII